MSTVSSDRNSSAKSNNEKVDFLSLDGELKNGKVYFQGKSMSELSRGMDDKSAAMSEKTEKALVEGAAQVAQSSPDHLYVYERKGSKVVLHTFKIPQSLQSAALKEMGLNVSNVSEDGEFEPLIRQENDSKIDFASIPKALDVLTGKKHSLEAVILPKIERVEIKESRKETVSTPNPAARQIEVYPKAEVHNLPKQVLSNLPKEDPRPRMISPEQRKNEEHWFLSEKKRVIESKPLREKEGKEEKQSRKSDPQRNVQVISADRRSINKEIINRKIINKDMRFGGKVGETIPASQNLKRKDRILKVIGKDPSAALNKLRAEMKPLKTALQGKISILKIRKKLPEPYNIFRKSAVEPISFSKVSNTRSKALSGMLSAESINTKTKSAKSRSMNIMGDNTRATTFPNLGDFRFESIKRPTKFQAVAQEASRLINPFSRRSKEILVRLKESKLFRTAVERIASLVGKIPQPVRKNLKLVYDKTKNITVKLLNELNRQAKFFVRDVKRALKATKSILTILFQKVRRDIGKRKAAARKPTKRRKIGKKIIARPKVAARRFSAKRKNAFSKRLKPRRRKFIKRIRSGHEDFRQQELIWNMMKKNSKDKRRLKRLRSRKPQRVI